MLEKQRQAWNRGDLEEFMQAYWKHDSLMFIGQSGVTYGWQQTLQNYRKSYPDTATMGRLDFTFIQFRKLSRRDYLVTGRWHLTRVAGNLAGSFSLLLQKIGGRWLIVYDHSS